MVSFLPLQHLLQLHSSWLLTVHTIFYILLQSIMPLMLRSLVRLVIVLVSEPAASITTLLYYSNLLPRNLNLERLVRRELIDRDNHLFNFLINFLRCFW
ncbi:putative Transmembrane protein [Melia azedarach]|uniref:Transmembrane protein n=1 Tax=Melia azedarach TaxID=155640 RepID=A0ACC1Y3R3_MELAZ|nr:putative Transmembrane protein [Melia azedarach]